MIDPLIPVRFLHFAATLLAAGTVCCAVLVAEPVLRQHAALVAFRRRGDAMICAALAVAAATGAVWLMLLAAQIPDADIWSVVSETRFGEVSLLRMALALLLAALVFLRTPRRLQLIVAVLLVIPIAFVGHAGAKPDVTGDLYLAADAVHVLAATAWLGALPAFAMLLVMARNEASIVVPATRRFSTVGIVCVSALLATGLVNAWNLVGSVEALTTTSYGRVLIAKIALFAAMTGVAAVNRLVLTPRLPQAARVLIRTSSAEVAFGLGVLLAVGALGTLEPGAHAVHEAGSAIPPDAAFVHIHMPEVMADVIIEPGRTGRARAIVRVMREDGTAYATQDVKLALDPPPPAAPVTSRSLQVMADGTWQVGGLELAPAGIWTVRVIVAMPGKEPAVLDAPIVIEPAM